MVSRARVRLKAKRAIRAKKLTFFLFMIRHHFSDNCSGSRWRGMRRNIGEIHIDRWRMIMSLVLVLFCWMMLMMIVLMRRKDHRRNYDNIRWRVRFDSWLYVVVVVERIMFTWNSFHQRETETESCISSEMKAKDEFFKVFLFFLLKSNFSFSTKHQTNTRHNRINNATSGRDGVLYR